MWQALHRELEQEPFTPLAVALDTGGAEATAEWIRRAEPTYPCLIDERHIVAELYGMVNVPSAVWIDEHGAVVRPTETAGASEAWRTEVDPETRKLTEAGRAELRRTRAAYLEAIRAWVLEGKHELHLPLPDAGQSLAAAHFRLAVHLHERGLDAHRHFAEAVRLRPRSWNYRRQAIALKRPTDAAEQFQAAVEATPPGEYYPPPPGLPL